jgi:hypothetical protein
MSFTINDLANELGIDVATLQAKGDVVSKWNGYLSEADNKYKTSTQAQQDAQEKLAQAQREQQIINDQIAQFGVNNATLEELRAANAAYKAAFETVKKSGLDIDLSGLPNPTTAAPVDPNKAMQDRYDNAFRHMGAAMRVQARYQQVFGKPYADDPTKLVDEALANRMSVEDYAERKYKFTDEQARISNETRQKEIQAGIDAGVKKYKEDNPTTAGNPGLQRGGASRHPQVFKPREGADRKAFANLPAKERLAQSVARGREMARSLGESA